MIDYPDRDHDCDHDCDLQSNDQSIMIVVPYAHGMCSVVIPYDLVTSFGLILTRVESSGGTWFGPVRRGGLFPPHRPRPKADFLSLSRARPRASRVASVRLSVSLSFAISLPSRSLRACLLPRPDRWQSS